MVHLDIELGDFVVSYAVQLMDATSVSVLFLTFLIRVNDIGRMTETYLLRNIEVTMIALHDNNAVFDLETSS